MGVTKTDLYTAEHNRLAAICKAIGHPARLAILQRLFTVNGCIGRELTDELGLAQPTVSRHLQALKDAGLIRGTIEGVSISYCINPEGWREVQQWFASIADRLECC